MSIRKEIMDDYNESINWLKAFRLRRKKLDLTRELQLDAEAIIERPESMFIEVSEKYIIVSHREYGGHIIYVFTTEDLSLITVIEGKTFRCSDGDYLAYGDFPSIGSYLRNIKTDQEYKLNDYRIIDINGNGNILTNEGLYKLKGDHLELIFLPQQIPFSIDGTIVTRDYLVNVIDSIIYIFDISSGTTVTKTLNTSEYNKIDSERNIILTRDIDYNYELISITKDSLEPIEIFTGFWTVQTINKSLDFLINENYDTFKSVIDVRKKRRPKKTFDKDVESVRVHPDGTAIFIVAPYYYKDKIYHKLTKLVSPSPP